MKKWTVRSISLLLCFVCLITSLPVTAKAEYIGEQFDLVFGKTYPQRRMTNLGWDYDQYNFTLTRTTKVTFKITIMYHVTDDIELYVSRKDYTIGGQPCSNVQDYESMDIEELTTPTAYTKGKYKYTIEYLLGPGDYYFSVFEDSYEHVYYSFSASRSNAVAPKPDRPTVKMTTDEGSGKPNLSWKTMKFAVKYSVYRATSSNGKYSKIKTVTGTSYTDSSAKGGQKYYYKVKSVNENDKTSSFSNVVSATCPMAQPKVKASNVLSTGKIKLSWSAVNGAAKYQIYRATSKDGEYTLMKTVTGTTYTNTSAKAGQTYFYKVRAVSANGAQSAFSNIVKRMCDLGNPDVSIKLKNGDPRLSWEKIAGATKYQIYRATSKSGKYTLMKTVTGTTYTNTSAKAGKTYFYKVKAIHKNTNANSAFSAIKSIKAK